MPPLAEPALVRHRLGRATPRPPAVNIGTAQRLADDVDDPGLQGIGRDPLDGVDGRDDRQKSAGNRALASIGSSSGMFASCVHGSG